MEPRRTIVAAGLRAVAPILLGVIPFGLISGVVAVDVGLTLAQTLGLSVIVFAGASQLAALALLDQRAAWPVILLTVAIINLRFMMYSAAIAPHFRRLSRLRRGLLAYLLTDQAFALSVARYARPPATRKAWYYLGVAMGLWGSWQLATLVGAVLGASVPGSWSLDFAIPLTFTALLIPVISDRALAASALAAALIAIVARPAPYNLGLILAALGGVGVGLALDRESAGGER